MLKQVIIKRYGTKATQEVARKTGDNPEQTFVAQLPELDSMSFSDEFIKDFLLVCPSKKYVGADAVYNFICKHMTDRIRANKKAEGKLKVLSGAQVMEFMTQATIQEIEVWKNTPQGLDRDNIVRRKLGLLVVDLKDEDESDE
jgi:hypothetical protein